MIVHEFNEDDLQKAAALFCEGMKKQEIAEILFVSEEEVERMIEAASQKDYFHYQPRPTSKVLSSDVYDFVSNEKLTSALNACLRRKMECTLTPITITPSPFTMFTRYTMSPNDESEDFKEYLDAEKESVRMTTWRAAQRLSSVLFDGEDHTIGLNWGAIVGETIMKVVPHASRMDHSAISVVSLFGDLDFFSPDGDLPSLVGMDMNCNNLVAQLVQRLRGNGEAVPLNVPGFIPAKFAKNQNTFDAIRDFMTSHSSYRRIFGDSPPEDPRQPRNVEGVRHRPTQAKIAHIDTIVTGLGAPDSYTVLRNYHTSLMDGDEIATFLKYCKKGKVVGDIGGHLVESRTGKEDQEVVDFLKNINRRLLAAQPSDFIDVASRYQKTKKGAGVIAVTVGARKAKILYTLLSWAPCPLSMLVIDSHCALALLNLIDPNSFKDFIASQEGGRLVEGHKKWSEGTKTLIPIE